MRDPDPPRPTSPAPLSYQSPGGHAKSQWITDDGPGGNWLVGCLIALSVIGVITAAVAGVVSLFFGF